MRISCSSVVTINVGHVLKSSIGTSGSSPTRRNSLFLGLGTGAERPQTCGVSPFKVSPSRRALNSLPLVSSDTLTPLVSYVCKLCLRNFEIVQTYCVNVLRNLKIVQTYYAISRLAYSFRILRMCSVILENVQIPRLRGTHLHPTHTDGMCVCRI